MPSFIATISRPMKRSQSKKNAHTIPRKIFRSVARELMQKFQSQSGGHHGWYNDALEALQTDAEEYLVDRFKNAQDLCSLTKTKTVNIQHFQYGHKKQNTPHPQDVEVAE